MQYLSIYKPVVASFSHPYLPGRHKTFAAFFLSANYKVSRLLQPSNAPHCNHLFQSSLTEGWRGVAHTPSPNPRYISSCAVLHRCNSSPLFCNTWVKGVYRSSLVRHRDVSNYNSVFLRKAYINILMYPPLFDHILECYQWKYSIPLLK